VPWRSMVNIDVEANVPDTLPMSVLLGTDIPQLQDLTGQELFTKNQPEMVEVILVVTTRALCLKQIQHKCNAAPSR